MGKHDILRDWDAVGQGRDEAVRKQPFRKCTIEAGRNKKRYGSWERLYLLAEKRIGS